MAAGGAGRPRAARSSRTSRPLGAPGHRPERFVETDAHVVAAVQDGAAVALALEQHAQGQVVADLHPEVLEAFRAPERARPDQIEPAGPDGGARGGILDGPDAPDHRDGAREGGRRRVEQQAGRVELREDGGVAEPIRLGVADDPAQGPGAHEHVAVAEEDPLSSAGARPRGERVELPEPALWQCGDVHGADPRVGRRDPVDDRRRGVGRAVVDQDQLQVRVVVGEPHGHRLPQPFLLVARRHHDRDVRLSARAAGQAGP